MSNPPRYLRNLVVGQSVRHWKFGVGEVLATASVEGRETAQIAFGARGVRLLTIDGARLVDPSLQVMSPWQELVDESTALEPLGAEPWAAWLGPAVVDDDVAFRQALRAIDTGLRPYPVGPMGGKEPGWPDVNVLLHPATARREAMVLAGVVVLSCPGGRRPFVGVPFYNDWNRTHVVTPRRIRLCKDRVEALVEADLHLGDEVFPIAFGMPTFTLGRDFLAPDRRVTVALTAFAFVCEPASTEPLRVRQQAEVLDALRTAGLDPFVDTDGSTTFGTAGMSAWIPGEGRPDLVEFRGRIVTAQQIVLPADQRAAWRLQVRAWRAGAVDWVLDVVLEASVWPSATAPTAGDDVQGHAWLLGECLGPT